MKLAKCLLEQLIPWRSFINSELFDNMCGISLTIGFNSQSMKAEMLEVALLNTGPALAKQCWMGIQGVTVGCEHSVQSTLN